jgi:hypothetical protein
MVCTAYFTIVAWGEGECTGNLTAEDAEVAEDFYPQITQILAEIK